MPASSVLGVLAVAVVLLSGCGDDGASSPPGNGAGGHGDASPVSADARHVEISARSFAFQPAQFTAAPGEELAIVLTADDGPHDFTLDGFRAHIAADAGQTGFGRFRAGEAGRYTFYCAVEGHRAAGMEGVLVVED